MHFYFRNYQGHTELGSFRSRIVIRTSTIFPSKTLSPSPYFRALLLFFSGYHLLFLPKGRYKLSHYLLVLAAWWSPSPHRPFTSLFSPPEELLLQMFPSLATHCCKLSLNVIFSQRLSLCLVLPKVTTPTTQSQNSFALPPCFSLLGHTC